MFHERFCYPAISLGIAFKKLNIAQVNPLIHRFNSVWWRFLPNSHANMQIVNKEVSNSLVVGGAGGLFNRKFPPSYQSLHLFEILEISFLFSTKNPYDPDFWSDLGF